MPMLLLRLGDKKGWLPPTPVERSCVPLRSDKGTSQGSRDHRIVDGRNEGSSVPIDGLTPLSFRCTDLPESLHGLRVPPVTRKRAEIVSACSSVCLQLDVGLPQEHPEVRTCRVTASAVACRDPARDPELPAVGVKLSYASTSATTSAESGQ